MDTRALRYFQAVAEFGSYSHGAKVLRISQPAVSRQIRALEGELGRALFIRHSHGVSLTDAGRILLERTQSILRQFDQAQAEIRDGQDGPSGTITFAVPPAAGTVLVPPVLARFGAAYPNVFPKVAAGFSSYTHEWLLRGRVDLACLHDPTPQPGFVLTPLVNEEVFLVGRRGAISPPRGQVSPAELVGIPLGATGAAERLPPSARPLAVTRRRGIGCAGGGGRPPDHPVAAGCGAGVQPADAQFVPDGVGAGRPASLAIAAARFLAARAGGTAGRAADGVGGRVGGHGARRRAGAVAGQGLARRQCAVGWTAFAFHRLAEPGIATTACTMVGCPRAAHPTDYFSIT